MQLVDDDGSEMIEFAEFLTIIKGGSKSKEDNDQSNATGAIYQFFKDLTSGKMKVEGNENIPFSLFISSMRRKKIMQSMMAADDRQKRDGEKILNNYKKQLAERMAREQAEADGLDIRSRPSTTGKSS